MITIKSLKKEVREIRQLGSMPDIDTDFEGQQRPRVKEYMEKRFGITQVTSLGTYTTMQLKAAITDLARCEGISIGTVRRITSKLRDEEGMKSIEDFFRVICSDTELREFVKNHTELINDVMVCLNSPKSASIHACGTVVYPDEKSSAQWLPVRESNGLVVTEWEGAEIEEAGFLKEDILGIAQLDKLADILKLIEKNRGIKLDLYNDVPLDDPIVFEYIEKGYLGDVFHFGAKGLSSYCVQMKPHSLDEMGLCAALYRPGPIENNYHNEYILRKRGESKIEYPIGAEDILRPHLGLLITQEDIMRLCQHLAGFDLETTDSVRKCIWGEELFWTPDGAVKIKNIKPFTSVTTYNEKECCFKWNKVYRRVYKKEKECIKLNMQGDNHFTCTPDHKLLTEVGWLEAKDCVGHYVYKDLSRRFGTLSKSKEELYLMIALLTEGSIGTIGSCNFVNKDESELSEFKRCYKEFVREEPKEYYNQYTGCTSLKIKDSVVTDLGLEFVKSDEKRLPDYIFSLNEECQLFVLGKLIDFDGYVASKKGGLLIGYSSKSKELIDQINILFSCLGVLTTTNSRSFAEYPEKYYDIGISSIEDALKIKAMLEPYSTKIKERFNFKLEDFDLDSYSQYKIPFEIWQPIIKNLIDHSGYNCNELLGKNILNYGINRPFDLTYRRAEKILKRCGRSKYLENILKREFCFLKVESYDRVGKLPVYDFTMTSDRSPYAFVGGILAHNCMGKKITSKLKSFGDKFVKGYIERFGVEEKYAQDLWKQMEEFGKYAFNFSHAIAYSRNGYNCIWLKAHYPIEFWSVTFSHAKIEDYPFYINEIQKLGNITIKSVDINKSDINIVSDVKTSSMYWALNSVKQCGDKAQEFIHNEREKHGEFFSLDEFIDRCVVKGSPVNKSVIENLIYSGAFDKLENITAPHERLRLIESYRKNKRVKILEDKDLLTNIIKARKEKNDWWWTLQQKKLSGFASFDYKRLIEEYHSDDAFSDAEYFDVSELKYWDGNDRSKCAIIGGFVIDIIERKSKKGLFATIVLESNYEFINVIVFPDLFAEYADFLRESKNNLLLVDGYIQFDKWRQEYVLQTNLNTLFTVLS